MAQLRVLRWVLNPAPQGGATPLFIAAQEGRLEEVQSLMAAGANITAPDKVREVWSFCRKGSSARLCWMLEEPKGPKGGGGGAHERCICFFMGVA